MYGASSGKQDVPGRRTTRGHKVSKRMGIVDDSSRQQAAAARLDALENDHEALETAGGGSDDDEYEDESDDDDPDANGKRKKKKQPSSAQGKKKLRGSSATADRPTSFARVLEEADLERLPPGTPNYLTAAAGPSTISAARKFCSVCGNMSGYTCTRCGSRYCCRKCYKLHIETRCLKFIA